MNGTSNTLVTLAASAIGRANRKRALRRIQKRNEAQRNLTRLGRTAAEQLLPCGCRCGNVCISGASQETRNRLLVQSVLQSASEGLPAVVLHEGNRPLEAALSRACAHFPYFRIINSRSPFYEPVLRLRDEEAAMMIAAASDAGSRIDAAGVLYLRALAALLRRRGIAPYLRMLAACPHNALQSVILQQEQAGRLTGDEATAIRNDVSAGAASRPAIECFFAQLLRETEILAWKKHLPQSASIGACLNAGGVIVIDVGSAGRKTQLALIAAELEHWLAKGRRCRVVLDAAFVGAAGRLAALFKSASGALRWTVSAPDIGGAGGSDGANAAEGEAAAWLALSHKAVVFAHPFHSARQLSGAFGEYERLEIAQSHAGNSSFGRFGLHFGANNQVSVSNKRERVVQPEEICGLGQDEFFLLDNAAASLYRGTLV